MKRALNVEVDHFLCVSNGRCLVHAPGVFAHNAMRQSEVVDPDAGTEADILQAAGDCPVGAIRVSDRDTGEIVFPPPDHESIE